MTREEAIEVIKDIYNYTKWDTYTTNEARTMAIKALEQEPRWIPVSERLPKDGGDYQVTLSFDVGSKEPAKEVRKDFYCILSKKWLYNDDEVTAWMPLPKPYKENKE